MNSNDYWKRREEEALKHRITDEKEYDKRIKKIYSDMLDSCTKEINAFYGKYADKEGITLAEAKKRVKQLDIEEYERKAKRYVKDKDFSPKANEEMRLYNAAMKINRLEMLKANIGLEMIAGHDELEKFMKGILKGRTEDELKRQAGILGKTILNNAKKAEAIVNASFHNANFSDRIWLYQDLMRSDLSNLLTEGLIRGKNPRTLAREVKEVFYGGDPKKDGGFLFCSQRLMRTELARVQTAAQKQSFERNGFGQYSFIVNGGCCPICEAIAKESPYKVAEMKPGKNAPPMHPFCRCSTAAYEDSEDYNAWLNYLEKGGTTEEFNKLPRLMQQEQDIKITSKANQNKYTVNRNLVNSKAFHDKFEALPISKNAQQAAYYESKVILEHRDGTKFEDVVVIDSKTGKFVSGNNTYEAPFKSAMTKEEYDKVQNHNSGVVLIHNHAEGTRPSKTDIFTAFNTSNVEMSVIPGHNGSVHCIYGLNRKIDIDKIYQMVYNNILEEYKNKDLAIIKATDALYKSGAFKYFVK